MKLELLTQLATIENVGKSCKINSIQHSTFLIESFGARYLNLAKHINRTLKQVNVLFILLNHMI